jgi:head-tail adaptor
MTTRREIRPTQSGELRHVGNIEQLITAVDAHGVPTSDYVLWAENVHFAIDDWKPYEQLAAQQLGSQLNTRIRLRYRPGIVPSMRLVYLTNPGMPDSVFEYYDIVGVVRDITMRVEMQLTCILRNAPGFRTGTAPNTAAMGVLPEGL